MFDSETEASGAMLLVGFASMEGMMFLQMLGRFSMLFLSKLDSDVELVTPS